MVNVKKLENSRITQALEHDTNTRLSMLQSKFTVSSHETSSQKKHTDADQLPGNNHELYDLYVSELTNIYKDVDFSCPTEDIDKKIAAIASTAILMEHTRSVQKSQSSIDEAIFNTLSKSRNNQANTTAEIDLLLSECLCISVNEGTCLTLLQHLGKTIGYVIHHLTFNLGKRAKEMYTIISLQTVLKNIKYYNAGKKQHQKSKDYLAFLSSDEISDSMSSSHVAQFYYIDALMKELYRSKLRLDQNNFAHLFFESMCDESSSNPSDIWNELILRNYLGDFSVKIREQRQKKNWTQSKLAEVSHVERTMIAKIERLNAFPTLETALKLLIALDLKPELTDSSLHLCDDPDEK